MTTRTTYAGLTTAAGDHLSRALAGCTRPGPEGPSHPAEGTYLVDSVGDLADALAHLGRTILGPIGAVSPSGRSRTARDLDLVERLAERARARDWSAPTPPAPDPAADVARAAALIRGAADLWATHHSPEGAPRSPEASRMRHPATLGAATREWRELVRAAAALADSVVAATDASIGTSTSARAGAASGHPGPACPDPVANLRDFPRPAGRADASPAEPPELPVARPPIRRGADPLAEIADRVDRIQRTTWALARSGEAPAPAMAVTAAIGALLAKGAAEAHVRAADSAPTETQREEHLGRADRARAEQAHWEQVARRVEPIRTAHPQRTALQIERLDLQRLLTSALAVSEPAALAGSAHGLTRALADYRVVAEHLATALLAAHRRGEIHVHGRALPNETLSRRPELLHAKLVDGVVRAPTLVVRRLEEDYRALSSGRRPTAGAGDRTRPAAPGADRSPAA